MASPNPKQARSPKDKPSTRVFAIRSPASRACCEVIGTASPMGLSVASQASSAEPSINKFTGYFRQIYRTGMRARVNSHNYGLLAAFAWDWVGG